MLPNITVDPDLQKKSVTADDYKGQYTPGSKAVWRVFVPTVGYSYVLALPPELPLYYSVYRDVILSATVQFETFWASAVGIAGTKQASKSFEVEGDVKLRVKRLQEIMLSLDGRGYVSGVQKGVRDFLTTDNGEFWEIVRASNASGSRILGMMHLDAMRCIRTGDPDIPLLYRDLKGQYHELQDYQVIMMSDMPSPRAEHFGVGFCAGSRAYTEIFKMAGMSRYLNEKITGSNPNEIHFISGVSVPTLETATVEGQAKQEQKGYVTYGGVTVIPVYIEGAVSGYKVEVSGVPDKFVRKEEFDIALLAYADAIGLDPQDLQPLSGQGLGTGAQSHVQHDKAKGKGLAARSKQFVHETNDKVGSLGTNFYFHEVDLLDQAASANIKKLHAETRQTQLANGEISNIEARAIAVADDDLPREFDPIEVPELNDTVSDEENSMLDENSQIETPEQVVADNVANDATEPPVNSPATTPAKAPATAPVAPAKPKPAIKIPPKISRTPKESQYTLDVLSELRAIRSELSENK